MTVTADWQAELAGVTVGAGTRYVLTGPITGLGIPTPRTGDAERGDRPGDVTGADVPARRVLTIPLGIDGDSAAEGWTLLETLSAAWSPSAADETFDLRLPGFGTTRRFYGRPRGVETDLSLLRHGWVDVLATFEALDPYAYGPETEVTLTGGDTPVTGGTAASDRWRLHLDVTTSPATFAVADSAEPPLTVETEPVTLIVDGRTRSVVDGAGVDRYGTVAAGSGWPVLPAGPATVTLTGATGTLVHRPAYL